MLDERARFWKHDSPQPIGHLFAFQIFGEVGGLPVMKIYGDAFIECSAHWNFQLYDWVLILGRITCYNEQKVVNFQHVF